MLGDVTAAWVIPKAAKSLPGEGAPAVQGVQEDSDLPDPETQRKTGHPDASQAQRGPQDRLREALGEEQGLAEGAVTLDLGMDGSLFGHRNDVSHEVRTRDGEG